MRVLILVGAFIVGAAAMSLPAYAQNYPWCAHYDADGGEINCGFSTFEQCLQDVRGIGGFCMRNNTYQPGPYR